MPSIPRKLLTGLLALSLLVACSTNNALQSQPAVEQPAAEEPAVEAPDEPESAVSPTPLPEPTEPPILQSELPPLPPERQAISIETSDGRVLEGFYYPGAYNPGPTIVLMHWAGGDYDDWTEIAPWLQNRGDETAALWQDVGVSYSAQNGEAWRDASWFPPMLDSTSFNVIVFNFGGFGNSTEGPNRTGLVDDALSAVKFASQLEGVDPNLIAALGASIGADGSANSCHLFNRNFSDMGTCLGAFSLSPGDYLGMPYDESVQYLDAAGYPVWCLAAEGDYNSPTICREAGGQDFYQYFIYADADHGMRLVTPDHMPAEPPLERNTLELTQDWLEAVYGYEVAP